MLLAGYCLLSYGWNYQHISKISFLVSVLFQEFSLLQQVESLFAIHVNSIFKIIEMLHS